MLSAFWWSSCFENASKNSETAIPVYIVGNVVVAAVVVVIAVVGVVALVCAEVVSFVEVVVFDTLVTLVAGM